MDNEKVLKAIEDVTAIVATFTSSVTTISFAAVAIKGIFSLVLGQSLTGPEYAAAMRRGIERNHGKISGRIAELEAE